MPEKRSFEMTDEEEAKYAKSGAWIALLLLPLVLLCICGIFAVTPGGRRAFYELVIQYSHDGIPLSDDMLVAYTRGLTGVARASCVLERKNPRPQNYNQAQAELAAEYQALVDYYKEYWGTFKKSGGDTSEYELPEDVPSDLLGARLRYCQR